MPMFATALYLAERNFWWNI